jgi:Ala-tRNA(Pro) deacylase
MGIALTVAQYLLDRGIPYTPVLHPHTETAFATASELPADRVVKAVALKSRDGFMLALLPASRNIEFGKLRRLLGDQVDLAGEEQVETIFFDCEPGSVPAFGEAYGIKVIVDDSLAQQPDLYIEGGDHAHLIHISAKSFQRLMQQAQHGRFAESETP